MSKVDFTETDWPDFGCWVLAVLTYSVPPSFVDCGSRWLVFLFLWLEIPVLVQQLSIFSSFSNVRLILSASLMLGFRPFLNNLILFLQIEYVERQPEDKSPAPLFEFVNTSRLYSTKTYKSNIVIYIIKSPVWFVWFHPPSFLPSFRP